MIYFQHQENTEIYWSTSPDVTSFGHFCQVFLVFFASHKTILTATADLIFTKQAGPVWQVRNKEQQTDFLSRQYLEFSKAVFIFFTSLQIYLLHFSSANMLFKSRSSTNDRFFPAFWHKILCSLLVHSLDLRFFKTDLWHLFELNRKPNNSNLTWMWIFHGRGSR